MKKTKAIDLEAIESPVVADCLPEILVTREFKVNACLICRAPGELQKNGKVYSCKQCGFEWMKRDI